MVLRRLAVFSAGFTLEAATAVAASAGVSAAQVFEGIANLVAKSLLAADLDGPVPCYRLLATTRAFALEKLAAAGEREQVERRLARCARAAGLTSVTLYPVRPMPTWFPLVLPVDGEAGAVPLTG
jgi:predicted ATPase